MSLATWLVAFGAQACGTEERTRASRDSGHEPDAGGEPETLPPTAEWERVGDLASLRSNHVATLLADGRVLVSGGNDLEGVSASVELYDPQTTRFSAAAPMRTTRQANEIVALENGLVLAAGGQDGSTLFATAELYDPSADTWSELDSELSSPRTLFGMVALSDGRVLAAGGRTPNGSTNTTTSSADLFDPESQEWRATTPMLQPYDQLVMLLLTDGRVLSVGLAGTLTPQKPQGTPSAELYDPEDESWTALDMPAPNHPGVYDLVLLDDGRALVLFGDQAYYYDPTEDAWEETPALPTVRYQTTMTLLSNGKVLVAGGREPNNEAASRQTADVLDVESNRWESGGVLNVRREGHAAARLETGQVLVTGGYKGGDPLYTDSAEVYSAPQN